MVPASAVLAAQAAFVGQVNPGLSDPSAVPATAISAVPVGHEPGGTLPEAVRFIDVRLTEQEVTS